MAARTDDETNGCTFLWRIENISHSLGLRIGTKIRSPSFIADTMERTKWKLWLFPVGNADENYVALSLYREKDCSGPNIIEVRFDLSFSSKDGSYLKKLTAPKFSFKKDDNFGCRQFVTIERLFVNEKEAFLPGDVLTVQCTIWSKEERPVKTELKSARTVYKVNRRSFVWRIDEFSSLKSSLKNHFKDSLIDFDLALKEELEQNWSFNETKLVININSINENIKYFSFKVSILDIEGKKDNCGTHEYYADDLKRGVLFMSSTQLSKKMMENKSLFLPNDVLSLECEYVIWTKTVFYEFFGSEFFFSESKIGDIENKNDQYIGKVEFQNTSVLVDDLKSMYSDATLSDTELRTSAHTFPAHKAILNARSPVFSRMFSNDMKEKNSGHVDIIDLEEDTVHRMLLYIYTDSLQDLQVESASELYAAADKYQILSLKNRCSSFLKDNLCPINVCHVLILADLYQDNDLNCFVQDYILQHEKEVFCSQEWKDLIDTNSKLAANIMHRRFLRS